MLTDDRKVIERVLNGETEAFNILIRRWEKPIYNYIVRLMGDRDEGMDVCQDCFMKAYRELRTLKDHDRFSSWLYQIAHNACLSRIRKDHGKKWVELDPDARSPHVPAENRLAVEKALRQLPEDQREVVILKVFQGLKFGEISAIQDAPVSTVKSRLYMAFEKLRSILE